MTDHDDYPTEMPEPPFDENTADALLSGARPPADAGLAEVANVLHELRATTTEPPAPPSPALASVLRNGLLTGSPLASPADRRGRRRTRVGWRRVLAPGGLGLALTTGGLTVAAAADVLPEPAQRVVAAVVNAITPLELPTPGRDPAPPTAPGLPGDPAGGGADADGRSPGDAPGGASPGQGPGDGGATPGQVPVSPGGTSMPSPSDGAPAPFPDPPGAPSAGGPSVPLPGAPDVRNPLPVPVPPPAVGTPTLPTTPTTAPLAPPTAPSLPRLPAP